MKFLVTIQHGENVHFFKNVITRLQAAGHEIAVCARQKEVNTDLLDAYGIEYALLCEEPESLPELFAVQVKYELRVLQLARSFGPDFVLTSNGVAGPHVAAVTGATSMNFVDTEAHIAAQQRLAVPFSDVVFTPDCLREDFGDSHVTYPGLHELAYLHPNQFQPDPTVLTDRGIDPDDPFSVVRLNAWDAHHDVGKSGLSDEAVHTLVGDLSTHGDVYVTHEGSSSPQLMQHELPVAPPDVHHLLYYADLFVGDVSTMTIEAAVLGTPTVRLSPFATERDMGKFRMLEEEYGLVYSFSPLQAGQALETVRSLITDPGSDAAWSRRRDELLDDTVDVTEYVFDRIESVVQNGKREHTDRALPARKSR